MIRHIVRSGAGARLTLRAATLAAAFGIAGLAPLTAQDAPLKVAVVNVEYVAVQSPAGKVLQGELSTLQQQLATELQTRQAAAEEIQQRIAAADSLTADEQRALEREYQDVVTNYQRYQQDMQQRAQAMRSQGLARIQEEIGPIIEAVQAEQGIDLVPNSGNAVVVLFSERIDITQTVLERLQAAGQGG